MTKGAKKSVRRWISALVSSRSSITIMGDSMLSLHCTRHLKHTSQRSLHCCQDRQSTFVLQVIEAILPSLRSTSILN